MTVLSFVNQSFIYDSRPDSKQISKKIAQVFLISPSRSSRIFSKDGYTKNLKLNKSSSLYIFYFILEYTIIRILTERFEIMDTTILEKKLGSPMSTKH